MVVLITCITMATTSLGWEGLGASILYHNHPWFISQTRDQSLVIIGSTFVWGALVQLHCAQQPKYTLPHLPKVPYSGKFSRGPNFLNFRDPQPKRENKNREIQNRENLNTWILEIFIPCILCASLAQSDVQRWHYSTISNRQTTSYPLPRDIFRPPLARRW